MTDDIFEIRLPRLRGLRAGLIFGALLFVTASAAPTAVRAQGKVWFGVDINTQPASAGAKIKLNDQEFTADHSGVATPDSTGEPLWSEFYWANSIPPGTYTLRVSIPDHPELRIQTVLPDSANSDQRLAPDESGAVTVTIRQTMSLAVYMEPAAPAGNQDPCYVRQRASRQGVDPLAGLKDQRRVAELRKMFLEELIRKRVPPADVPPTDTVTKESVDEWLGRISIATIERRFGEAVKCVKKGRNYLKKAPNSLTSKEQLSVREQLTLCQMDQDYWTALLEQRGGVLDIKLKLMPLRQNYPQLLHEKRAYETKRLAELERRIADARAKAESLACQRIKVITKLYCSDVDYQAHKNAQGRSMKIAFSGRYVGTVDTDPSGVGSLSMTPGSYQITPRLPAPDAKLVSIIKHIPGNTPDTDESGPSLNFVAISNPKQGSEYEVTVTIISYEACQ